mgnify:CR=1 FL=1
MRVGLPHDQVVTHRIQLAALVTEDDTGRDAGSTHHDRKRRGVVLAKSTARLEQELVHRVATESGRLERVVELFGIELPQDGIDVCRVGACRRAHPHSECHGIGVASCRHGEVPGPVRIADVGFGPVIGIGNSLVGDALIDGLDALLRTDGLL